jgi:hypothetical protein
MDVHEDPTVSEIFVFPHVPGREEVLPRLLASHSETQPEHRSGATRRRLYMWTEKCNGGFDAEHLSEMERSAMELGRKCSSCTW